MSLAFGLHNEIQVPRPWTERKEYNTFKAIIDQAVLAEQVGFDWWSTVEHHFLAEFSHSSAPECLYPYVAAKTEKIRIGHGVRLLPFPYNHPVRLAEAAATLDLVCDGRLEFGTGRSVSWDELNGFGIDPKDTRAMSAEALEVIVGCWTEDTFAYEGKYFKLPPRHVIPKPLQKPHPPLWIAGTGPEAHEIAGRMGVGCLSFVLLVPLDEVKRRIDLYKAALADAQPVGKFINDTSACFTFVHCAETNKEARKTAAEWFPWATKIAVDLILSVANEVPALNPANGATSKINLDEDLGSYEYMRPLLEFDKDTVTIDYLIDNDLVIVGDPDTCIKKVELYQETGVDRLLGMHQVGGIPNEKVMKSIELFGKHVIPAFHKLEPGHHVAGPIGSSETVGV